MKVLVTGVNGQLGHDMMLELKRRNHEPTGSGSGPEYRGHDSVAAMPYEQMNITDAQNVQDVLKRLQPDAVVHCSAWTAVDAAEEEGNREKVFSLNVNGTRNIAEACRAIGAKLVYLSTDYVFDGQGIRPWQPDDRNYAPLNVYGQSKLEGEFAVRETLEQAFIVRIAWVFGRNGKNFIRTMLNVAKTHNTVRVVNDQIGTPTYTADLARLLTDMLETERYGTYHATNAETEPGAYISWYDFTCEIYRQAGLKVHVIPVSTEEYGLSRAKRPFNSRLDKSKLLQEGFRPLPDWKDALARYLKELDGEI